MKCNHCGSEWTTTVENQKTTCPFCGKTISGNTSGQPAERGRFQLSFDRKTLVQFLGDEKNVVIPAGITRIGAGAFHGYGVETVYIPDGVTEIGDNCFNGCKQLREVRIPNSVSFISDTAFRDTGKVKIVAQKDSYAFKKYEKSSNNNQETAHGSVASDNTPPAQPKTSTNQKPTVSNEGKKANDLSEGVKTTPADTPKPTTNVQKTIPAEVKTPETNKIDAKKAFEDELDELLSIQNREFRWAKLLNCKPGEKPWIVKTGLFVNTDKRANKLIANIRKIDDQELLFRITCESNREDVQLAAVANITDQAYLNKLSTNRNYKIRRAVVKKLKDQKTVELLALKDADASVRETAVAYVQNKDVLLTIAQKDTSSYVREAALMRVGDSQTITKFILSTDRDVDEQLVKRVTSVQDLQKLAISGTFSVRKQAANMLPADAQETRLLKAAAELSQQIVPYAVERFKKAAAKLKESNPSFLATVALRYPLPGVRYLARGETHINPKDTANIEERLKSQTPSQVELEQRARIKRCEELLRIVYDQVRAFTENCDDLSKQGKNHYETECHDYTYCPFKSEADADHVAGMLRTELKLKGFTQAQVAKVAKYRTNKRYTGNGEWVTESEFLGYNILISTSW